MNEVVIFISECVAQIIFGKFWSFLKGFGFSSLMDFDTPTPMLLGVVTNL